MSMRYTPDPAAVPWHWPLYGLALLVILAAISDVRSHRIPNLLVGAGLALAVVAGVSLGTLGGLLHAGAGLLVALTVWLPMYLLRTLGAGDVKLMAMVGAFLGPIDVLSATLLILLAGGVLSLGYALNKGALSKLLTNVRGMLCGAAVELVLTRTTTVCPPIESVGKLPYAVAIAAGSIGQIVLQQSGHSLL